MRYLKMLGLAAIAAAALMAAGAGTASATHLTSTGATLPVGTTFHMTQEAGQTSLIENTTSSLIETCTESTVHGSIEKTGGVTVTGKIGTLTWGGCSTTKHTLKAGTLHIDKAGTVTSSGASWTVNIGVSCLYGTTAAGTHLGTLTTGTLAINAVINEQEPKQFLCPDTTRWTAKYEITTPHDVSVESSATNLTSTGATLPVGTTLHATLEPGETALLEDTVGGFVDTCPASTVHGSIESTGGATVTGKIGILSWGPGCTATTTTIKPGVLHITSAGTVSSSGASVTVNPGVTCLYGTPATGTHLGTLSTGTLNINAVINEQEPKQFLCPDTTKWTAKYLITTPHDVSAE